MKSWPKIRRGKLKRTTSGANCFRPDCKPLRKMLKSSISLDRPRSSRESKRRTNFHHSMSEEHPITQLHQPTPRLIRQNPHIQQLSTSTLWRLQHPNMMIFWMICLQIKDTRPMHAATSRRGEHRWSRTSSKASGAIVARLSLIRRSMRPISEWTRNSALQWISERQLERGLLLRPRSSRENRCVISRTHMGLYKRRRSRLTSARDSDSSMWTHLPGERCKSKRTGYKRTRQNCSGKWMRDRLMPWVRSWCTGSTINSTASL
jgi:hypothetical protein